MKRDLLDLTEEDLIICIEVNRCEKRIVLNKQSLVTVGSKEWVKHARRNNPLRLEPVIKDGNECEDAGNLQGGKQEEALS
jgi:hypothetical protein